MSKIDALFSSYNFRVIWLSKRYLTDEGIISVSLKSLGQYLIHDKSSPLPTDGLTLIKEKLKKTMQT